MSNYRDDIQDTAIITDKTWIGLKSIVDDVFRVSATLAITIGVTHHDAAALVDTTYSQTHYGIVEQAKGSDEVTTKLSAVDNRYDQATLKDSTRQSVFAKLQDNAISTEQLTQSSLFYMQDSATVTEEYTQERTARVFLVNTAKLKDTTIRIASEYSEDSLLVSDTTTTKIRAKQKVVDSAILEDSLLEVGSNKAQHITDSALLTDYTTTRLDAVNWVTESAYMSDSFIGYDFGGMAWTANTDTWAMSRYEPYSFNELAVIDGILYGINHEGVYQLTNTEPQSPISAKITTGKIDVSNGSLAHPIAAYIEHELVGSASMDITTTQDNIEQTYTYPLTGKPAEYMNSGRFIFGRGLRGRHFAVSLNLEATKAHINDLRLNVEPVKRRV